MSRRALAQRHGVGDHDPGQRPGVQGLERVAREQPVGGDRVDPLGALVEHRLGRGVERAAGGDDVVDDHRGLALDVADHVADLRHLLGGALLLHQRVGRADLLGELADELHPAGVRGDDHEVLVAQAVLHVLGQDRHRGHVVDGLGEEALQLAGVQVHRDQAVDAGGLQHLGHQPRRDRLARGGLLVLARVAVPGGDGDDAVRRGVLGRVDHEQQLPERVVDGEALALGAADRLDDEQVGAADRLGVAAVDLAVGEGLEPGVGELEPELFGDLAAQLAARAAGGDHQALLVAGRDARVGAQEQWPISRRLLIRLSSSTRSA